MQRSQRTKRASVQDIYASCIHGGDCPTDVKNKVEGNTWADALLKIFSSVIYLGNLGIGTGKGSGGSFGYKPFGAQPTRPGSGTPIPTRPSIPTVDVIGPAEIAPIGPEAPAIVPLSEGVPELGIIDTPGGGPGLDSNIVEITTAVDPLSEVSGVGEHPNITTSTGDVAVIDVQINPPPPKQIKLDYPETPITHTALTRISHTDPDINVFVNPLFNGTNIGPPEYIELDVINPRAEFEIEEGIAESTPIAERISTRARDLYNRYVVQVPTRRPENVGLSSRLFTTQFENPAFDTDVTDLFLNDVEELSIESGPSMTPRLTATPTGTIRASRLTRKPGMTTRSGLDIGQRVHVYYDFSPIPRTDIELQTFGETTGESTLVDELATSTFINPFEEAINGFPDSALEDLLEEDFSTGHLLLTNGTAGEGEDLEIPVLSPEFNIKVFVNGIEDTSFTSMAYTTNNSIVVPSGIPSIGPLYPSEINLYDYDLHPSLRKRKRKRNIF
ncbi:L2 [Human papillomavirus 181]|nr:L2 [Human papillomavirus 181]